MKNDNNKNMKIYKDWKDSNQKYLNEIQKFLDKADNIESEELKEEIIIQMLKCDEILTKIAEEKFEEITKNCEKK